MASQERLRATFPDRAQATQSANLFLQPSGLWSNEILSLSGYSDPYVVRNAYANQPKIEVFEQFDNLRMVAFVDMKDINDSPKWNPNLGAPPLDVGEAIKAVKDFVKDKNDLAAIKEIEIRPFPRNVNHWHYLVKIADEKMKTKYDIYVVLMDGKVIPAIIEPQSLR